MKFLKGKYTQAQQAWCENYEARTGFDPLMDDFEAGNESFYEGATKSVSWYEDHSNDALLSISNAIPGFDDAFRARLEASDAVPKHG
ncbi:hypothetical protein R70006_06170 [Paraburkholderia domus]|nr:hypothetical protein [Burkholderia sp. R-70006]CAE6820399.1 hypothetical protein R70006_06170 [Paraburkholderia domus]